MEVDWQLCQTTVRNNAGQYYLISTAFRRASTMVPCYFYETLIWRSKVGERMEQLVATRDSGRWVNGALADHQRIAAVLARRYAKQNERRFVRAVGE